MEELECESEDVISFKSPPEVNYNIIELGIRHIKLNKALPRDLKILEDARGIKTNISIDDIDVLLSKMHDAAKQFKSIKHAVIHDKPENTAIALLFEDRSVHPQYQFKVFSTEKAAKKWLKRSYN